EYQPAHCRLCDAEFLHRSWSDACKRPPLFVSTFRSNRQDAERHSAYGSVLIQDWSSRFFVVRFMDSRVIKRISAGEHRRISQKESRIRGDRQRAKRDHLCDARDARYDEAACSGPDIHLAWIVLHVDVFRLNDLATRIRCE